MAVPWEKAKEMFSNIPKGNRYPEEIKKNYRLYCGTSTTGAPAAKAEENALAVLRRFLLLFKLPDQCLLRCNIDGLIMLINHHAGLRSGRFFNIFNSCIIDCYI